MPRTRNSSIDEVDSSASESGDEGLGSVLMANGAKLIGMYLVGTVITIGALMLTFLFQLALRFIPKKNAKHFLFHFDSLIYFYHLLQLDKIQLLPRAIVDPSTRNCCLVMLELVHRTLDFGLVTDLYGLGKIMMKPL